MHLGSHDGQRAVRAYLQDTAAAGLAGEEFGPRRHAVVHPPFQLLFYIIIYLRRGTSAEVGTGADQRGAEAAHHLLAEGMARASDAERPVVGRQVGGHREVQAVLPYLARQYIGRRPSAVALPTAHSPRSTLRTPLPTLHQDQHAFRAVALLDAVQPFDRLGVAGVAADAPDGVGGIEQGASAAEHLDRACDNIFHNGCKNTKKTPHSLVILSFFCIFASCKRLQIEEKVNLN